MDGPQGRSETSSSFRCPCFSPEKWTPPYQNGPTLLHNGRFLRFSATTRNIVYFDSTTKSDKTARHCTMDEFHYSTHQDHRPVGAQDLLSRLLPNHVPPCDKPDNPDSTPELLDTTITNPPVALDSVTDGTEQPITANAAHLKSTRSFRKRHFWIPHNLHHL